MCEHTQDRYSKEIQYNHTLAAYTLNMYTHKLPFKTLTHKKPTLATHKHTDRRTNLGLSYRPFQGHSIIYPDALWFRLGRRMQLFRTMCHNGHINTDLEGRRTLVPHKYSFLGITNRCFSAGFYTIILSLATENAAYH